MVLTKFKAETMALPKDNSEIMEFRTQQKQIVQNSRKAFQQNLEKIIYKKTGDIMQTTPAPKTADEAIKVLLVES